MKASETAMRALQTILAAEPGHAGVYYAEIISRELGLSASQSFRHVATARIVLGDDKFPGTQRVGWWERGAERPYAKNGWPIRNRRVGARA